MIRKLAMYFAGAILLLAAIGVILYIDNPAPHVAGIDVATLNDSSRPYVIKVHAKWCPVCMMTKDMWNQVESTYAGKVRLVVFDVTDSASERASRAEAQRLGLGESFDDYAGSTGTVYVLNGADKALITSIHGSRDFSDYRKAIDGALSARN